MLLVGFTEAGGWQLVPLGLANRPPCARMDSNILHPLPLVLLLVDTKGFVVPSSYRR